MEHACRDPKDGELCLSGAKPEETLVEARSDTNVQIVRLTWVQGRKTNRILRIAGAHYEFYQVKPMIRGIGGATPSTYSQTLNR